MKNLFDVIMRIVSSLAGLAIVALGIVWTLQGLGIAFQVGFMANHRQWAIYGTLLAILGICQIFWSVTRRV